MGLVVILNPRYVTGPILNLPQLCYSSGYRGVLSTGVILDAECRWTGTAIVYWAIQVNEQRTS
jgi:hypothetical protein